MAQDDDAVEAILLSRERARRDALVADDSTALADLVTDDLVHVHTTGNVQGKAAFLAHAGGFLRFMEVERGPLNVRVLAPGVAVMTGPMTNTVARRGVDETVTVKAFVTQIWVLRDGEWRVASFHAVRLQDD